MAKTPSLFPLWPGDQANIDTELVGVCSEFEAICGLECH